MDDTLRDNNDITASDTEQQAKDISGNDDSVNDQLTELRTLLLQPEQERIEKINERLDDPVLHAHDISQVLPEALLLSAKQNDKLSNALRPTVEELLRVSIKRNIHTFSDILFPVIGPAIRKAISESLKQMVQSLSQTLDRSFSWQGLKWRLESMRTGKPFAEVVMLHGMLYQVEQVFLIHAQTGLLLQHVSAGSEDFQDADLVSGMLTAIQDFVKDSFRVEAGNELSTIQMGDFTIWLVQGPKAVLAGAIRGTAPEELRRTFNNTLEVIHMELADVLDDFDGDAAQMEAARPHLQACLQSQQKSKSRKLSPLMIILLLLLLSGAGFLAYQSYEQQSQWQNYLQILKSEPGIVVTQAEKTDGIYQVSGLRDPLSRSPEDIFSGYEGYPSEVKYFFQPYQSLDNNIIQLRAQQILLPPDSVQLSFTQGILSAAGTASPVWIDNARLLARAIPGVMHYDDSNLSNMVDLSSLQAPDSITFIFRNNVLKAKGSASYQWILSARRQALELPGVNRYDDSDVTIEPDLSALQAPDSVKLEFKDGLLSASGTAAHQWFISAREKALQIPGVIRYSDTDLQDEALLEWQQLKQDIEQTVMLFGVDAANQWQESMANKLTLIPNKIKRLLQLSKKLNRPLQILIIGHSDSSGRPLRNQELSQGRAEYMYFYLIAQGINAQHLSFRGVGTSEPVKIEQSEEDKKMNRSVTFKIYLIE